MSNKKVYIVSGAGLSAESGIRTFRDTNGLWEEHRVEDVCSVDGFNRDRQLVLDFYDARRADVEHKEPNHAHKRLAELKNAYPENIVMLTQNVDDMLERAGCTSIIHLHGTLTDLRCEACDTVFPIGYKTQEGAICPNCGSSHIRHNVVMFGEAAPEYQHLSKLYSEAEMVVVIGTSGQVIDTASMAQRIQHSVLNNLDVDDYHDRAFKTKLYVPATEAVDEICNLVEEFLED
ncbi:MAG: NAD-dependent protein deacetylase of SIR2 family [uncultured Sulfurovum sp.]|uniref:protein acetyllysine N-acetyltransferase n=1 Tax=uncultured Sulfurovum sp. TaxID=269237 RepID=A0A6S6SZX3_9BACT|nr:MAG: NAD-dependent protein deacetylase of SIR2 family [uncultured Sulfurovum sp.]